METKVINQYEVIKNSFLKKDKTVSNHKIGLDINRNYLKSVMDLNYSLSTLQKMIKSVLQFKSIDDCLIMGNEEMTKVNQCIFVYVTENKIKSNQVQFKFFLKYGTIRQLNFCYKDGTKKEAKTHFKIGDFLKVIALNKDKIDAILKREAKKVTPQNIEIYRPKKVA